jgi:hypothetical protein
MALFSGRDRTGANADFKGDGGATAFILSGGAITARPTVLDNHVAQVVGQAAEGLETIPANATHALVSVDSTAANGIRFRDDGGAASATVGHMISPGSAVELAVNPLSDVSLYALGSGNITVQVSYRRYDTAA